MNRRAAIFAAIAWLYLVGIIAQVILAGASLFVELDWSVHGELGYGLGTGVLLVLLAGLATRPDRRTVGYLVALTASGLIQPMLAEAREVAPFVAAFHPVNALALTWLAWVVARRATALSGFPALPGRRSLEDGTGSHL